jgi:hypothetical protein
MSTPRIIEYDGQRLTIAQWARRLGIKPATLKSRLRIMPLAKALKPGTNARKVLYEGRRLTVNQLAREIGLKPATLKSRLRYGWPVGIAASRDLRFRPFGSGERRKPLTG